MKVLVIGGGGREHALAWAISKSSELRTLFVAPGNGGTEAFATNVALDPNDLAAVGQFVREHDIDLTVVGPEAPLVAGIVDQLQGDGRLCFGPTKRAARLEGSKVFAKEFMRRHRIPTADYAFFEAPEHARKYAHEYELPIVIKADGLAQGKGVVVADTREKVDAAIDDIMIGQKFGESGRKVLVEECLVGVEVSIHAICGGGQAILLPTSQDHKRVFDNDEGPNTGGMGAYGPVPFMTDAAIEHISKTVIDATLQGMEKEGSPFSGVLYAGLMITKNGPRVLEFNVRFGDPETQVLLPLLDGDLLQSLHQSASQKVPDALRIHKGRSAATVVAAAKGYPGDYNKGYVINGVDGVDDNQRVVFHAGTMRSDKGLATSGGRVLSVTAWGDDLAAAIHHAYDGIENIKFDGVHYRKDIGRQAL